MGGDVDFINHCQWLSSGERSKLDAPLTSDSDQCLRGNGTFSALRTPTTGYHFSTAHNCASVWCFLQRS
ncbi:hypothetical protein ACZ76_03260 [Yersinia aleksiciae]|uniref:Uncharacterized protein n=1 Tax=Yersinia aleksiciae TaxID=263819 RepID=A0ABM5UA28_YERAE|nr:hypothetical protein ACZ76_03260 [Yersinia aleksiciae]